MTYRLKDRDVQQKLDDLSEGEFSLRIACIRPDPDRFQTIWFSIGGRNASLLVFDDDVEWVEDEEEND